MHNIQSVEYILKVFIINPPTSYLLHYKCHFNVDKRGKREELCLLFTVESNVNLLPKSQHEGHDTYCPLMFANGH